MGFAADPQLSIDGTSGIDFAKNPAQRASPRQTGQLTSSHDAIQIYRREIGGKSKSSNQSCVDERIFVDTPDNRAHSSAAIRL